MNQLHIAQWLTALAETAFRSTALLAVCGLATVCIRRNAAARHLIWLLTLGGVLLMPLLTTLLPSITTTVHVAEMVPGWRVASPHTPWAEGYATDNSPVADPVSHLSLAPMVEGRRGRPFTMAGRPTTTLRGEAPGFVGAHWGMILCFTWLAGAIVILSRLLLGLRAVRAFGWTASPAGAELQRRADGVAHGMGLARPVKLLLAADDAVGMPMTWGWLRPCVLLPASAEGWPTDRVRSVLLHEMAHILRADWFAQWFASLACALYWFNPLVWLAAVRLKVESERATDEFVVCQGVRPREYCRHLLEVAENMRSNNCALGSYALPMARVGGIETRMRAVLDNRAKRRGVARGTAMVAFAAVGTCVALLATLRVKADSDENSSSKVRGGQARLPNHEGTPSLVTDENAPNITSVDLSSPESTLISFITEINHRNMAAAARCVAGTNPQGDFRVMQHALQDADLQLLVYHLIPYIKGSSAQVGIRYGEYQAFGMYGSIQGELVRMERRKGCWLIVPGMASVVGGVASGLTDQPRYAARMHERFEIDSCTRNLHKLIQAAFEDAADNGGRIIFDNATFSQKLLSRYKDPKVLHCPEDVAGAVSYSFNDRLKNVLLSSISQPDKTVLFYEGHDGNLDYRHSQVLAMVAYADGHTKGEPLDSRLPLKFAP